MVLYFEYLKRSICALFKDKSWLEKERVRILERYDLTEVSSKVIDSLFEPIDDERWELCEHLNDRDPVKVTESLAKLLDGVIVMAVKFDLPLDEFFDQIQVSKYNQ